MSFYCTLTWPPAAALPAAGSTPLYPGQNTRELGARSLSLPVPTRFQIPGDPASVDAFWGGSKDCIPVSFAATVAAISDPIVAQVQC